MFKSGDFLEENCKHAPKTTEILRQMPGIYTVFFSIIDQGEKYYWHNGEGVIFDDAYLHDVKNDSDEVRVVMWIDVRRKMPWWLQAFGIAEREVFRAPRERAFDLACGVGFSANVLVLFLLDACVLPPQLGKGS
jgi:aspartyl/asparaginyl beta-hydroxylase (cupin superfamily)